VERQISQVFPRTKRHPAAPGTDAPLDDISGEEPLMVMKGRATRLLRSRFVRACLRTAPLLLAGLAACDIPTGLPRFETRIAIPLDGTRLRVSQLVPAGVSVTPAAFHIGVAAASGSRSLAQMCGTPCTSAAGLVVPKPAFTDAFSLTSALPASIVSATLASGEAEIRVAHTFAWDPLRPPGSTTNGVLRVVLRSAGREVGRDSITTFAAPVTRVIALAPGVVNSSVVVEVSIVSPAGSAVFINTSSSIGITVQPRNITAAAAHVLVQNRAVSAEALSLDLTRVEDDVRDRVQRGSVILAIDNPFTVAGELELRLNVPGVVDVRRAVALAQGATSVRVDLSRDEARALLGRMVDVSLAGPVSQTAGAVALLPTDAVIISPVVSLILEIGS
jgi:hypothetical protein